jgi:hypothetical protein
MYPCPSHVAVPTISLMGDSTVAHFDWSVQVHKATLRSNGQTVVVKVQHDNIQTIMHTDLKNLELIVRYDPLGTLSIPCSDL